MKAPLATIIAMVAGVIVLAGYFLPLPNLSELRIWMLGWAATLIGVASLVGILNLIGVHWRKLNARRSRDIYSFFLILAFILTVAFGIWLTPADPQFQHVVTSIQTPVETTLLAILTFTLAFAALRLLQRRMGLMTIVFILSVVFFLTLNIFFFSAAGETPLFSGLLGLFNRLPLAGGRGILLGIALGSLVTGLRVLLGIDRPYSG